MRYRARINCRAVTVEATASELENGFRPLLRFWSAGWCDSWSCNQIHEMSEDAERYAAERLESMGFEKVED